MHDSSGRTHVVQQRAGSPLTGRLVIGFILLVMVGAGIGFAVWRNSASATKDTAAQESTRAAAVPVDIASVAAKASPTLNDFQETIESLKTSQKQILEEIESIKQKIAAEQGERKLLTAQLGSLSLRLDELSAASASISEGGSTGQSQKRRAKSR